MQYIAQANCGSQLRSVEAHAAAQGRFYISKYFPTTTPLGFRSSAHSSDDARSSVSESVINKQNYAHNSTQLSARKMGIESS